MKQLTNSAVVAVILLTQLLVSCGKDKSVIITPVTPPVQHLPAQPSLALTLRSTAFQKGSDTIDIVSDGQILTMGDNDITGAKYVVVKGLTNDSSVTIVATNKANGKDEYGVSTNTKIITAPVWSPVITALCNFGTPIKMYSNQWFDLDQSGNIMVATASDAPIDPNSLQLYTDGSGGIGPAYTPMPGAWSIKGEDSISFDRGATFAAVKPAADLKSFKLLQKSLRLDLSDPNKPGEPVINIRIFK